MPRPSAFQESIEHLAAAVRGEPNRQRFSAALGRALLWAGQPADAVPALVRGLGAEPTPGQTWLLGTAYLLSGNPAEGQVWAEASLDGNEDFARGRLLLAECRAAQGDWESALALSDDLLGSSQHGEGVALRTAGLWMKAAWNTSDPPERRRRLERARAALVARVVKSHEPCWRYLLGTVLVECGEPQRALVHLERTEQPHPAEVSLRKGVAHLMLGHREEGLSHLADASDHHAGARGIARDVLNGRIPIAGAFQSPPPDERALPDLLLESPGDDTAGDPDDAPTEPEFLDAEASADTLDQPASPVEGPTGPCDELRARELRVAGEARLAEGRLRLAGATLCRAFDVLTRPGPSPRPSSVTDARHAILAGLLRAADDPAIVAPLARRAAEEFPTLVDTHRPLAEGIAHHLIAHGDPAESEVLMAFAEILMARVRLSRPAHQQLVRSMAQHLKVSSRTGAASPDRVKLLWRIHHARPELAFCRLYLARHACSRERFQEAWDLLAGMSGPLAARGRVLNLAGRCAEALGKFGDAERAFRASLAARPDQPDIQFRLGRLLLAQACRVHPPNRSQPAQSTTTEAGRGESMSAE